VDCFELPIKQEATPAPSLRDEALREPPARYCSLLNLYAWVDNEAPKESIPGVGAPSIRR
jgi:hypothetical protein